MLLDLLLGLFPPLCLLVLGCLCSQGLETVGLRDTLSPLTLYEEECEAALQTN